MDPVDIDTQHKESDDMAYNRRLDDATARHVDAITQDVGQTQEFLSESLANLRGLELAHAHNLLELRDKSELGQFIDGLYREYVNNLAFYLAREEIK
jgi:hypothetical protein